MVGDNFHTGITVFTETLVAVSGVNHTVFLPIAEVLVATAFGVVADLVIVGCSGGVCFDGLC